MENSINADANNDDPLALQPETEDSVEYGINISFEPEIIEDTRQLRRSKRCSNNQLRVEVQQTEVELRQTDDDSSPAPLFPFTLKMVERIKRMKQRMLVTLKQLPERSEKRANQTRESRQRATNADVDYRRKETEMKIAKTKKQRQMQRAKKREENRRYLTKRCRSENTEQKTALNEYRRLYRTNRKPINFA
ncbi:GH18397 [Drosophila grimshawi]|uniref:GH18397 n=1 Tax=Drosophila grimshawi TaxID=7222 RepID=B4JES4_DROGR|nr:GH18397 [Drosophila grimshawi]